MGIGADNGFAMPSDWAAMVDWLSDNAIADVDDITSGTLRQLRFKIPVNKIYGAYVYMQVIAGYDTDCDNAESVTFMDAFYSTPIIVLTGENLGGGSAAKALSPSSPSTTGFTYSSGQDNFKCWWIAVGAGLVTL